MLDYYYLSDNCLKLFAGKRIKPHIEKKEDFIKILKIKIFHIFNLSR